MSVSGVSIGVGRGNEHRVIDIEVILGIEQPRGHRIVGVDNGSELMRRLVLQFVAAGSEIQSNR